MVLSNNEKQNTVSLIENITISTSDILDEASVVSVHSKIKGLISLYVWLPYPVLTVLKISY